MPVSDLERRGDELLAAISSKAGDIGDRPLTLHWPTVGAAFDHGVLVVGQAVFGWMNTWTPLNVKDPAARAGVIAEAKDPFDDLRDPMGWIDGHRVRTSPFWRVAHDVTDALAPGDAPWFSRLAWANLYPIAPNDVKANPGGTLLEAQTRPAAAFLDAAIREIHPRLILVVGGPYVWPFVQPLGLGVLGPADKPLYLKGRRDGIDWIAGMHPGGASRRGWGPTRYAELIITTARSIAGASHGADDRNRDRAPDADLIRRFEADMEAIYAGAKAIGYIANRFLMMLREHGGLETAHRLLRGTEISYGFTELWMLGRQDLTIEALVLRPEYATLFSSEELATARTRLAG